MSWPSRDSLTPHLLALRLTSTDRATRVCRVFPLFQEHATLLSGAASRLTFERAPWLPVCPPEWQMLEREQASQQGGSAPHGALTVARTVTSPPAHGSGRGVPHTCCLDDELRGRMMREHGLRGGMREMRPQGPSLYAPGGRGGWLVAAAREVIWANLGVYEEPPDAAPTALFVSFDGASNQRRIADEAAVAEAVRGVVAQARPHWRFRRQRLEQLSYTNEMRLLRSTRLFICLFSAGCVRVLSRTLARRDCDLAYSRVLSRTEIVRRAAILSGPIGSRVRSLTNCQFLPPGAIVIQIHGALRGEIASGSALHQYRADFCTRGLGLRWAGYAAHGWRRLYPDEALHEDFSHARVEPARFARFIARALGGQWEMINRQFVDDIRRADNGSIDEAGVLQLMAEAEAADPREVAPFKFE